VNKLVSEHLVLMPVPESVVVCGELGALSVTVSAPDRVPVTVGVKVTLMVQETLGANDPPHSPPDGTVELTAKSPVGVMELTVSVPVPVLMSVT
jgi:hypothetical protein